MICFFARLMFLILSPTVSLLSQSHRAESKNHVVLPNPPCPCRICRWRELRNPHCLHRPLLCCFVSCLDLCGWNCSTTSSRNASLGWRNSDWYPVGSESTQYCPDTRSICSSRRDWVSMLGVSNWWGGSQCTCTNET
jgi:hypothetical protein